jgi:hypothetical protein
MSVAKLGSSIIGLRSILPVIAFNDAFGRSYAEIVEVLSEAKTLATIDAGAIEVETHTGSVA